MEAENPGSAEDVKEGTPVADRVGQFLDAEGDRIRQETERIQSPIIAKARQEYKQRLAAFLEEEHGKIKGEAEKEAVAIRSRAESEANAIAAQAQAEKREIIKEAQRQAGQMIEEAIKEGDKDRERVVAEGQKQADAIIEEARQSAARLTSEAAELARKTVEVECDRILTEARAKAHDESQSIVSNSWQRAQQMLDSAEAAYKLVRAQLQDCVKAIIAADSKMEIIVAAGSEGGQEQSESNLGDAHSELVA